jgi:phosphoribosylformimino-5-aminoimidazole carboxamide ribotide isomerase
VSACTLYPAIDILGGKAVRLEQGDFGRDTTYAPDPVQAALAWVTQGAKALHVVDLDGARAGRPVALEHLRSIAAQTGLPVQYGGGLREADHLEAALQAGAWRVVLGTAAFRDERLLEVALARYGSQLAVAVDVREGHVTTSGWTSPTEIDGREAIEALRAKGVRTFVYTNVDRDGMLSGPDPDEVVAVSEAVGDGRFLYSGGIGVLDDLAALARLGLPNLAGVVVGKALYERRFTVADAEALLNAPEARPSPPRAPG